MKLWINGQLSEITECLTVADLLAIPPWQGRMVIVELNGKVLYNGQYESAVLTDEDRLELVHFVGGG